MNDTKARKLLIKKYCEEKGKDVSNELEAILNYCIILNLGIEFYSYSNSARMRIAGDDYKIFIYPEGEIMYSYYSKEIELYYVDFRINCINIENEIEFFNMLINNNKNKIEEFKKKNKDKLL